MIAGPTFAVWRTGRSFSNDCYGTEEREAEPGATQPRSTGEGGGYSFGFRIFPFLPVNYIAAKLQAVYVVFRVKNAQ
jgi:hypothetical protein